MMFVCNFIHDAKIYLIEGRVQEKRPDRLRVYLTDIKGKIMMFCSILNGKLKNESREKELQPYT
jgi:hypothetical protein